MHPGVGGRAASAATILARGVVGYSGVCDDPHAYDIAQQEWKSAVCDNAAEQSDAWPQIAAELGYAELADGGDPAAYKAAVSELKAIAIIPETGATTAQQNEFSTDVRQLNGFFNTPGLYITDTTTC